MPHLIVGDGHYRGDHDEVGRFSALLEAGRAAGMDTLSVLGDFFELWLGLEGLEQPWHAALFSVLRDHQARGVTLHYVCGNKDFFIEDWNRRHRLFDTVTRGRLTLPHPGGGLHLEHGDLANHTDRQYRLWHRLAHSAPLEVVARSLPRRWLGRLGADTEVRMRATNRYHKSYFPEAQLRMRAAETAPPSGTALLVYGHFHVHRVIEVPGCTVVTLPFLGAENAGIVVDEAGWRRVSS